VSPASTNHLYPPHHTSWVSLPPASSVSEELFRLIIRTTLIQVILEASLRTGSLDFVKKYTILFVGTNKLREK
jgi:hypothetical protein